MPQYSRTELLDLMKFNLGRGNGGVMVADELFGDTRLYFLLSQAQTQVYGDLMPIAPWVFVSIPWKMETTDGGITYDIPGWMFGHTEIYANLNGSRPMYASSYGALGCPDEFVFEGSRIRMAGNRPRTFADGPYVRYCGMPADISASRDPDMMPFEARELILWKALELAANVPQAMMDSQPWKTLYDTSLQRWMLLFRTSLSAPQEGNARTAWSWQLSLSMYNQ